MNHAMRSQGSQSLQHVRQRVGRAEGVDGAEPLDGLAGAGVRIARGRPRVAQAQTGMYGMYERGSIVQLDGSDVSLHLWVDPSLERPS